MATEKGEPKLEIDLFEQFKTMPIRQLAQYAQAFNIFLSNREKEGILIGYLDMEKESPEVVKVLVDGDAVYWTEEDTKYVKAENRKWEPANK